MSEIQVSIVIPTFNRGELLRESLPALVSQQSEGFRYEVIFVDDGSTDQSADLIAEFVRSNPAILRYESIPHSGSPGRPRNEGVKAARGEVIILLDDDVVPNPDLVERHWRFHQANPAGHAAALGHLFVPPETLSDPMSLFHKFPYAEAGRMPKLTYLFFWTCNVSVKRSFMLSHGVFDEDSALHPLEDMECGYRLFQAGLDLQYLPHATGAHLHKTQPADVAKKGQRTGRAQVELLRKVPDVGVRARFGILTPQLPFTLLAWRFLRRCAFRIVDNPLTIWMLRAMGAETRRRDAITDAYYYLMFRRNMLLGYAQATRELSAAPAPALASVVSKAAHSESFPAAVPDAMTTVGAEVNPAPIDLTIVIPTYNRQELLPRVLAALINQESAGMRHEILFADDGSTDKTPDLIAGAVLQRPGIFRHLRLPHTGSPAFPRNQGVREARGKVILLLDDDVIPDPALALQHWRFHQQHPERQAAALGHLYLPPDVKRDPMSFLHQFREDQILAARELNYLFFWSGHVSLKRDFMLAHGMFNEDPVLHPLEDMECGYRLWKGGMKLQYLPQASGGHAHKMNAASIPARGQRLGRAQNALEMKIPDPEMMRHFHILSSNLTFPAYQIGSARRVFMEGIDNPVIRALVKNLGGTSPTRSWATDLHHYLTFRRNTVAGYRAAVRERKQTRVGQPIET